MAEKTKQKPAITPAGIVKFAWVDQPSFKFNADGKYSLDLLLDPKQDGVQAFLDGLEQQAKAAHAQAVKDNPKKKAFGVHVPFGPELDDDGNETGMVLVRFQQSHKIKRVNPKPGDEPFWFKTVDRFDGKGKPLPKHVRIGRGSRVKAAFMAVPFTSDSLKKHGLTLRLEAVQVLALVAPGGGRDAADYGFGEEPGGYEYTEEQADTNPDTVSGNESGEAPAGDPGKGDF